MVALGMLKLDNIEYRLMTFDYKSRQSLDNSGKPFGKSTGALIDLTIESDSNTALLEWMLGNDSKDGVITFYKPDGMSKFNEVRFQKSYCISFREVFEADGILPMRQMITISQPKNETIKKVVTPPAKVVQEKPQKKITEVTWMCSEMKDSINQASVGEKTSLLVKTVNYYEGETITIVVDELNGKDLKSGTKEITFTGQVNADGVAELKEKIEIL